MKAMKEERRDVLGEGSEEERTIRGDGITKAKTNAAKTCMESSQVPWS